jgi:phosphoglycolate phosphatase
MKLSLQASSVRALLVDLDGTLVDTVDDFVQALQRMLHDLPAPCSNYRVGADEVRQLVGKGSEHLVRSLLARVQVWAQAQHSAAPPPDADQALASYLAHYREVNGQQARVYPGAAQALADWRARGWLLACVTNKPGAYARELLARLGLEDCFSVVIGGDATPRKKPDPMPLLLACTELGVAAHEALMVGDSSNDAQAARAAGCPVALVTYGYNHGEDIRTADADLWLESLTDLLPALEPQCLL